MTKSTGVIEARKNLKIESLPGEIWKDVYGFSGYKISNLGRVASYGSRGNYLRKLRVKKNGYVEVNMRKDGAYHFRLVHRLVLIAFAGLPATPNMQGRHLDGNRSNNRLANLAWGTHAENENDKIIHGTKLLGEDCNCAKLTNEQVLEIRERKAKSKNRNWGAVQLANKFGVSYSTITRVAERRTWSHVR